MEFADKIRIPKLNGVTMRGPHISNTSTGTLVITGHHLIFSSRSEDVELWVNSQLVNIFFLPISKIDIGKFITFSIMTTT